MKKLVFFAFIFMIIFFSVPNIGEGIQTNQNEELDLQVIPDEAIRLRILANSDGEHDQQIKHMVRDRVNAEITEWVEHITDIEEARELIEANIPEIRNMVQETLEEAGEVKGFTVEYNDHVSFPAKVYGDFLYPAGEYEAILITIGEGNGSNWWCVLFPPLCFLDFSSGMSVAEASPSEVDELEEVEEEKEEPKVKFFLFEWLGWS